ncbi:flavoprotein [Aquabacter spiritensis]|uniref:Flavoprotein n=1 Tax=Aquabacter spiritensis TaxID=933073 RepID=A0A4R3LPZ5_9HYPH|nr:flavoprotein [Aquabacter spiritensis]TCT02604.1 flavoprotein [Aquabacter spiritensis]
MNAPAPRWAWALSGSGHFFSETFDLLAEIGDVDLFVSAAAAEVLRMYRKDGHPLPPSTKVFRDTTASAAPVGLFYEGRYHTLVVAPASSNTVAKCVLGISDTLVTNCFAQAGKCRIPAIVFACDSAPELTTMAPGGPVKVYPRRIDLENTTRLKSFDDTVVAESFADLVSAVRVRRNGLHPCRPA